MKAKRGASDADPNRSTEGKASSKRSKLAHVLEEATREELEALVIPCAKTNFLSLPTEIRLQIYGHLLIGPDDGDIEYDIQAAMRPASSFPHFRSPSIFPHIILANRTICDEASTVLYGKNIFSFVNFEAANLVHFIDGIGSHNSNLIRHLSFDFPQFWVCERTEDPGNVTLYSPDAKMLETIAERCGNLKSLTIRPYSLRNAISQADDEGGAIYGFSEALRLLNVCLTAIGSSQGRAKDVRPLEITVQVYEHPYDEYESSERIWAEMERYGWTVEKEDCPCDCECERWDTHSDWEDLDEDMISLLIANGHSSW
jgi:hypothetical protein